MSNTNDKFRVGDKVIRNCNGKELTVVWVGDLGHYLGFTDDRGYYELSVDVVTKA